MKTDMTVSKKATINTGNYSSISPSVSLTLNGIEIEEVFEVYEDLNTLTAAMFMHEFETMAEMQDEVKTLGISEFFRQLGHGDMEIDVNEAIKRLAQKL